MASSNISLAPGLGYGVAVNRRSASSSSDIKVLAKAAEKELCRLAVDFFIRNCHLGASILARKMGWSSEVKTMLAGSPKLTKDDLERLAGQLGLTLPNLMAIGKHPPLDQTERFKCQFEELGLVVNKKLFAKPSFF